MDAERNNSANSPQSANPEFAMAKELNKNLKPERSRFALSIQQEENY